MTDTLVCPMSGFEFKNPCPNRDCPANVAHNLAQDSCLILRTEGTTLRGIAEGTGQSLSVVKIDAEFQVKGLATALHHFQECLAQPDTRSCPSCGYLRPCTSPTLCQSRQAAVQTEIKRMESFGSVDLKPHQIWWGVVHHHDTYLAPEQRDHLKPLCAARDMPSEGTIP